jgi:hypothetical protein
MIKSAPVKYKCLPIHLHAILHAIRVPSSAPIQARKLLVAHRAWPLDDLQALCACDVLYVERGLV